MPFRSVDHFEVSLGGLMLFMIIETFRDGDPKPIRQRFIRDGRMMPDDVVYHASWVDPQKARCFQIVEAPDATRLHAWTQCWADLMDFEIVPVLLSQDYWSRFG